MFWREVNGKYWRPVLSEIGRQFIICPLSYIPIFEQFEAAWNS